MKAETSFFLDALDFWLDLGIRQNIIRQLLQWAILLKFSPSKILYCMVLLFQMICLAFMELMIKYLMM